MPTPMVHLAVGLRLAQDWGRFADQPSYYLGLIAPDAIHMREEPGRDDKIRSHLMRAAYHLIPLDELLASTAAFIAEHRALDEGYIAGYAAHVLTDRLWVARYEDARLSRLFGAGGRMDRAAYYNDLDQADIALYRQLPQRPAIWRLLEAARPIDLNGLVSSGEAGRWRNHVLRWFDAALADMGRYRPATIITDEYVRSFVADAAIQVPRLLRQCAAWPAG
ncbi:MAG: hypothetical protein GX558_12775 [Clostridiales bacterium]|nr:hypothetical protein [Clostridiales bacterium]